MVPSAFVHLSTTKAKKTKKLSLLNPTARTIPFDYFSYQKQLFIAHKKSPLNSLKGLPRPPCEISKLISILFPNRLRP